MRLPVWLVSDPDNTTWVFVAASTRGSARWSAAWPFFDDEALTLRVRRVLADGTIGGRGPQAMVDANDGDELSEAQRRALGWRACRRCDEYLTHDPSGVCAACLDEAADEIEWAAYQRDGAL